MSSGADQRMQSQGGKQQPQSHSQDPNFGAAAMGGFEDWACEDFNLLEFVGNDPNEYTINDETDYNNLTEEESMHKNDLIYQTLQYNELVAKDHGGYGYDAYQHDVYGNDQYHNGYAPQLDQSQMPSTSKSSATGGAMMAPMKDIKDEPVYDGGAYYDASDMHHTAASAASSTTSGSSTNTPFPDGAQQPGGQSDYVPKIKPRKYRMKPDQEKANPVYRVKREKNNDAVRRSRDKAKKHQQEKEERLAFLEQEELKNKRLIAQLEERNRFLDKELVRMKGNCRCTATSSTSRR